MAAPGFAGPGRRPSFWTASARPPEFPSLSADTKADVCVVGAGIAGLTTAYCLMKDGASVVVLEDGPVGGGETGRTTGHLSNALDDRYAWLEKRHGREGARLAAESHTAAIDMVESIASQEGIACGFERLDGYLFVPLGEPASVLEEEIAAAHRAGLTDVSWAERAPLPSFNTGRCLRFPRQAQFHSIQYLSGLAAALKKGGARLFTGTHADRIQGGVPARVRTRHGRTVTCGAVVVATNAPVSGRVAVHVKQAAYRTYVIAGRVPRESMPRHLAWDTADPYHYLRLQALDERSDLLLAGGEDHKTGQESDFDRRFRALEAWARARVSALGSLEYRWSGQVVESVDGLAHIGRDPAGPPNVYVVTGDSGNGLTHGTLAGRLLCDLIAKRENPWAALYDPARINWPSTMDFLRENLNAARQYGDWATAGQAPSAQSIPPGQGAVIRCGLAKQAVHRDERGKVHVRSAVCTHLGAIVRWNPAECTWDCPAHGSRFHALGEVLNAPANAPLKTVEGKPRADKRGEPAGGEKPVSGKQSISRGVETR